MTHVEQFNLENTCRRELLQSKNLFLLKFMQISLRNLKPPYLHSCITYGQKVIFGTKNDYLGMFDQIPNYAVSLPV